MSNGPQLFKIDPCKKTTEPVSEIDFGGVGFQERRDIQEWIADNPSILGEELLIIAKEFSGFDRTSERPDLVAVDTDGNVVVIELKRDDTGANVHWQAIKYASYFQRAKPEDIIELLAVNTKISEEEAIDRLRKHLDSDDLQDLNRDQRIILASHRFAPEVISSVVWLNEKATTEDLIRCVQLMPYRDRDSNSFYIQASTILPIPGIEVVGLDFSRPVTSPSVRKDEISRFLRGAATVAMAALPEDLRPDRRSRWAGVGPFNRYYQLWYSEFPWGNQAIRYQLLLPKETRSAPFVITIKFRCDKQDQIKRHRENRKGFSEKDLITLREHLEPLRVPDSERIIQEDEKWLVLDESITGDALDTTFRDQVGDMVRGFIEAVTPVVNELVEEKNEVSD